MDEVRSILSRMFRDPEGRSRRPFILLATASACVSITACGGSSLDIEQVESDVRSELSRQLPSVAPGTRVESVDCVRQGDSDTGRCLASIAGEASGKLPIKVTFGDDSEFLWEAETGDLQRAVLALNGEAGQQAEDVEMTAEPSAGQQDVDAAVAVLEAGNREVVREDDDLDGDGDTVGELYADGVTITFFVSADDAKRETAAVKGVFSRTSGRGLVQRHGTRMYWMGEERQLTSQERGTFREIVTAVEAAL